MAMKSRNGGLGGNGTPKISCSQGSIEDDNGEDDMQLEEGE
jgi:hypothetical protein